MLARHFERLTPADPPVSPPTTDPPATSASPHRTSLTGLARLIGWTNIAAATDHYRSHPADGLQLLGFTT